MTLELPYSLRCAQFNSALSTASFRTTARSHTTLTPPLCHNTTRPTDTKRVTPFAHPIPTTLLLLHGFSTCIHVVVNRSTPTSLPVGDSTAISCLACTAFVNGRHVTRWLLCALSEEGNPRLAACRCRVGPPARQPLLHFMCHQLRPPPPQTLPQPQSTHLPHPLLPPLARLCRRGSRLATC